MSFEASSSEANEREEISKSFSEAFMTPLTAFLTQLTEEVPLGETPRPFWDGLMAQVAKQMGADLALLFQYNEEIKEWSLYASFGLPERFLRQGLLSRGWQSLPTIIFQEGSSLFSEDIAQDRRFIGQMIRGTSVRAFAGTTLQTKKGPVGSLCVGFNAVEALTEAQRSLFLLLSKLVCLLLIPSPVPLVIPSVAPASPTPPTPSEESLKVKILEAILPAFLSALHREDFLKEIFKKIVPLFDADSGYLLQFDQARPLLIPVAHEGFSSELVKRIALQGITVDKLWSKTVQKNAPLFLSFENWKSPLKKRLCGKEKFKSLLAVAVPSSDAGEAWGWMVLFRRASLFSEREGMLLECAGEKMSQLLRTATLWQALSQKVEMSALIQSLDLDITRGESYLFSSLLNNVQRILRVCHVYLLLRDDSRNVLYGVAASKDAPGFPSNAEIRMEEETFGPLTVKQNSPLVIEDAASDPRVDKKWIEPFRSRSLLSIPLTTKEQVIGLLLLSETASTRSFTEEEIQTVMVLSSPIALAIKTAIRYQEAREQKERYENLALTLLRTVEQERRRMTHLFENKALDLEKALKKLEELCEASPLPEDHHTKEHLEKISLTLGKVAQELKTAASDHPFNLLEKQGLRAALKEYTETFSKQTGIAVQFLAPPSLKRTSPGMERSLYRIVQEALLNVRHHANARGIIVSIKKEEVSWHLSVTDDGKGFDAKQHFATPLHKRHGTGILGMKGRTELLGGTFFIDSAPGHGTRVSIKIPTVQRRGL